VSDLLRARWWQGVAGIAQILAAVFAIVTIIQARKTIRQADEERRFSVGPDWDLVKTVFPMRRLGAGTSSMLVMLEFSNTGFGPARQTHVCFRPRNGNEPFGLSWTPQDPKVVPASGVLQVRFGVNKGKPLDGELVIESTSRFGELVHCGFEVQTKDFEDRMTALSVTRLSEAGSPTSSPAP